MSQDMNDLQEPWFHLSFKLLLWALLCAGGRVKTIFSYWISYLRHHTSGWYPLASRLRFISGHRVLWLKTLVKGKAKFTLEQATKARWISLFDQTNYGKIPQITSRSYPFKSTLIRYTQIMQQFDTLYHIFHPLRRFLSSKSPPQRPCIWTPEYQIIKTSLSFLDNYRVRLITRSVLRGGKCGKLDRY
jgi:hypothetical protein